MKNKNVYIKNANFLIKLKNITFKKMKGIIRMKNKNDSIRQFT